MGRGRKAKPSALKRLTGNPGKRKLNTAEPAFEVAIPDAPGHLDDIAIAEWTRITQELAAKQVITEVDMTILALYCETFSEWIMLNNLLKNQSIVKEYKSGAEYVNLLIGQRRSARMELSKYAAELGITPSSRTKVKMIGKAAPTQRTKKDDLTEEFFSHVKMPVSK